MLQSVDYHYIVYILSNKQFAPLRCVLFKFNELLYVNDVKNKL